MTDAELSKQLLQWLQPDMLRETRPSGQLRTFEGLVEEAARRLATK